MVRPVPAKSATMRSYTVIFRKDSWFRKVVGNCSRPIARDHTGVLRAAPAITRHGDLNSTILLSAPMRASVVNSFGKVTVHAL